MFYIIKRRYGVYPEEVISKHRKIDVAERRLEDIKKRHALYLEANRFFSTDGTEYYIKEV